MMNEEQRVQFEKYINTHYQQDIQSSNENESNGILSLIATGGMLMIQKFIKKNDKDKEQSDNANNFQ